MDIKNGELFLFATRKKFGMQEGIKMSELPAQPIDACCRIQYVFGRWYLLLPCQVEGTILHPRPLFSIFAKLYKNIKIEALATNMDVHQLFAFIGKKTREQKQYQHQCMQDRGGQVSCGWTSWGIGSRCANSKHSIRKTSVENLLQTRKN